MAAARAGSAKSKRLDAIVTATRSLMLEEGYAAVTYRSVAARAGVVPGLVQYYFPNLDDLFIALLRTGTENVIEELTAAVAAEQPLRAVWKHASDRAGTALLLECMALGNHRKAVAEVIGAGGERVRAALLENLTSRWADCGLDEAELSPRAVLFLLAAIPRMAHLEEDFGTSTGHEEAMALVERFLDRVEPLPASPRNLDGELDFHS